MSKNRIVVIDSGYDSFEYEAKLFTDAGYSFEIFPGTRHDREGKKKFAGEAEGLFVRWTDINDDFFEATPNLKAIVRYGVGYDNIDVEAATRFGVKISIVQDYANNAVSDHTMAMMYACVRALPRGELSLKTSYTEPPIQKIFELHDKTLGIIGLGRIGGTFCRKAHPLFKNVLASDPYINDERFLSLGATKCTLNVLLKNCHVISIHCNLTEETTELINRETLGLMAQKPILINTSRGTVINEDDLYDALEEGKLHSVGLDVFHDEPPLENRDNLLQHPCVISTGHYAWYSKASLAELQKRAADDLLAMLRGQIPDDCLNP
jgi:D-3-phosphoglycerate dehydrogenase